MGTNAIIGTPHGTDGFRGRYVHYDGYPTGVGADLARIVGRDGTEQALRVLTVEHHAWTSLNADTTEADAADPILAWGGDVVPGYGLAMPNGPDSPLEWYTDTDAANVGAQWAYAITDDAVRVWRHSYVTGEWTRQDDIAIVPTVAGAA